MKLLSEYQENEKFQGQLLIVSSLKGVTNNGLSYLTIEVRDSSLQMNAKKWEVTPEDEEVFVAGNVVDITGEIIFYKSGLQMKILKGKNVNPDEVDVVKFSKVAPIPYETLLNQFNKYRGEVKNKDLKAIMDYILNKYETKFLAYPAASSIHHDYMHGLLHHTVSMLNHAEHFINYYGGIDKELLYTGVILHDIGKTIELYGPVVFKYSLEGKLIGHISIMHGEIVKAKDVLNIHSEKSLLLEHMILAHHGQLEFGSPIMPLTKEAFLLSQIDNLDSKLNLLDKSLETVKEGEFTNKIFALDNRSFYKPNKD